MQLEVTGVDEDGELLAQPIEKKVKLKGRICVAANRKIKPELSVGDVFLGKVTPSYGVLYARPIARIAMKNDAIEKLYGVVEKQNGKVMIVSSEKNSRQSYLVTNLKGGCKVGDFVSFVLQGNRRFKEVQIIKSFGKFDLNKAASSLVLEKYNIPYEFPDEIFKETKKLPKLNQKCRTDLTNLPFVTIDGEDSKDFDDAVWAEKNEGGFRIAVAIADVAFYVRHLSEIDREAYRRGNSVYLPNRVVPMLPEVLCNDLCSLCPKEERPAIVCFMEISPQGKILKYKFERAMIKSAARLTYNEVQNALDGKKSENIAPLYQSVVVPVYEAYQALKKASKKRGALELELDEFKVKFDKNGQVKAVEKMPHLEAEQIIEEFMIAANVSAALMLKKKKLPIMYRVHDKPKSERLGDMEGLLETLEMKVPDEASLKPEHFNKVLCACKERGLAAGVSDMVLRMQSQAQYTPHNIGHFGLGLTDYVHFTSPIRRYADLLIHRALIKALKMPDNGALEDGATEKLFEETGTHLCETERKAVNAEREMNARYLAEYLKPAVGQEFEVAITGLSTAGIFVRIESLGAEGLIPMNSLPYDKYILPENRLSLRGAKTKREFKFGEVVNAVLKESNPITGGLIFRLIEG